MCNHYILDLVLDSNKVFASLHRPLILYWRPAMCFQSSFPPLFMFVDFTPKALRRSVISAHKCLIRSYKEVKGLHSAKSKETHSNQQTLSKLELEQASLSGTRYQFSLSFLFGLILLSQYPSLSVFTQLCESWNQSLYCRSGSAFTRKGVGWVPCSRTSQWQLLEERTTFFFSPPFLSFTFKSIGSLV